MTPLAIGLVGILVLMVLLFLKVPIGIAMGIVAIAGFAWLKGMNSSLSLLQVVPYATFSSHGLSVLPLFILMGEFAFVTGLSDDLYGAVRSWFARLRGGLAMATVVACGGFAAICGSSVATAATMGTVALPEMKKYKYDPGLATGSIAAGGTLGILIPPSISFIIYGVITEQSIGRLFMAGFLPGLLLVTIFLITIYVITTLNPKAGPTGPRTSMADKLLQLRKTWAVLILFMVVIGGIYLGVFTPTEAGGVGAFGVFAIGILRRRLGWKNFKNGLVQAGRTTAMGFMILLGAMLFGYFLAVSRLPSELAGIISGMDVDRYIVLGVILLLYLVLGCLMDTMSMILITVPIFFPLILDLGFDPIWFGVMITMISELGLITPPIGMNVFIISGIDKDIPMYTVFRGIIPFVGAIVVAMAILVAFPHIALFLPNMMK